MVNKRVLKVALVNPPFNKEGYYGDLKSLAPELPLLGIAFLSSYVKNFGFDIKLLDLTLTSLDEATEVLCNFDIVGFSVFITNYNTVIALSRKIKIIKNNIIIIIGGPHPTLFPLDFQESEVDFIVSGEGELPFKEILTALLNDRPVSHMPGLGYRNEKKMLMLDGKAPYIDDLDMIGPPDLRKYDLKRYYPALHVQGKKVIHTVTSRGCPYQCSFCAAAAIMGRHIRFRKTPSIINELISYKDLGYDSIIFSDDTFTVNKERIIELCKAMIKHKLNFKWMCYARTDNCTDKDMLNIMREAGCYLIHFGCESANDKTLKLLNKGLTNEINAKAINIVSGANIFASSGFMVGLPGETIGDIMNTINFVKQSNLTFAVFPIFEPFKGTAIYEVAKKMGSWQKIKGDSNQLLLNQDEIWVPDSISRAEVLLLSRKAYTEFYSKPKRLIRIAKYALLYQPPSRAFSFIKTGLSCFTRFLNYTKSYNRVS